VRRRSEKFIAEGSKYAHWIGLYLSFNFSWVLGPFVHVRPQNLKTSEDTFGHDITRLRSALNQPFCLSVFSAHKIVAEDIMLKDVKVISYKTTYEEVRSLLTENHALRAIPLVEDTCESQSFLPHRDRITTLSKEGPPSTHFMGQPMYPPEIKPLWLCDAIHIK